MTTVIRSMRRTIRGPLSRILGWLLGLRRRPGRADAIERILVIRIDERVGNVLLTTPLLDALREWFPDASIEVLVASSKRRLLEGVADVVPFEKRTAYRAPLAFVRLLWQLRRRRYDVVIDASHWHRFSLTSAVLSAWTGAALRIAHDRGDVRRFATETVPPPVKEESEITTKLRLMEPLGIHGTVRPMRTGLGHGSAALKIAEWITTHGLADPIVGLAPGGRKADHRVDPSVFVALGKFAVERGARVVVLWGPGEEALAGSVAEGCGAVVAPPTDLDELAAFMRRCAATVTNDTGPMHLSVACGAPTIALFRSSEPARWGHQGPPHTVVRAEARSVEAIVEEAKAALADRLA